jgi:hypothetical protein
MSKKQHRKRRKFTAEYKAEVVGSANSLENRHIASRLSLI